MAWSRLPEVPDDPLPPGFFRWIGLTVLSALCIFMVWTEMTLVTDRLILGIYAVPLLVIGFVLTITAIVKLIRRKIAKGALAGLAIVAATFALLGWELPSALLDKYRLNKYQAPLRETLLWIQKENPNLEPKQEYEEANQYIPADIPPSIAHARFFLYKPRGPTIQNIKRGVVTYGLRVDTIECRVEIGNDAPSRCEPIVRWSK